MRKAKQGSPRVSVDEASTMQRPIFALPVKPAALSLGISKSRLYELIAARQIRAVKIGARTVIPVDEISKFLASCPDAAA